jgi:hypothetical protein
MPSWFGEETHIYFACNVSGVSAAGMPDASAEPGVAERNPFSYKGAVTKISWRPKELTTAVSGVRTVTLVMPAECISIDSWLEGDTLRYANTYRPSFVICPPSLALLLREQAVYWPMQQQSLYAAWQSVTSPSFPGESVGLSVLRPLLSQYIRASPVDGMVTVKGLNYVEDCGPFGHGFTVILNVAGMMEQCNRYIFRLTNIRLRLDCPGRLVFEVRQDTEQRGQEEDGLIDRAPPSYRLLLPLLLPCSLLPTFILFSPFLAELG